MMPLTEEATATVFPGYIPRHEEYAANTTQIVTFPVNDARDYMLASQKSLASIWDSPEEDEAWKDL
jgi:hypothetical protein